MRAFVVVAAIIGYVIGYNCYLHVWKNDLTTCVIIAVASFAGFLTWFARITRPQS